MINFNTLDEAYNFLKKHKENLIIKSKTLTFDRDMMVIEYAIYIVDKVITFIEENYIKPESTILFQVKRYCNRYRYSMMLECDDSSTGE